MPLTGSNPQNAAVAATSGLLEAIMNREELEAVMGSEAAHEKRTHFLCLARSHGMA